jgi:hypothetical protein
MNIVRVLPNQKFENYKEYLNDINAFAIKSGYQKNQKHVVHSKDRTIIPLCLSLQPLSESKVTALILNYSQAMKLASVHHIYGKKPVNGLLIPDPLTLINVQFGKIGQFLGVPIYFNNSLLLEKFPPILVHSKHETPFIIKVGKDLKTTLTPKNVTVFPETGFANCAQIIDTEIKVAMEAYRNMEEYKRFAKQLAMNIERSETINAEEDEPTDSE